MTASKTACVVAALVIAASREASAQSLGRIAEREAQRRKDVHTGRLYTNVDLNAVAAEPPKAQMIAPAAEPTPARAVAREKRDDAYWRERGEAIRARLQQAEDYAAGLQARSAELEANTSAEGLKERQLAAAMLARAQRDVEYIRQELATFEQRARSRRVETEP